MHSYNVLIVGDGLLKPKIEKSKFLKKIFLASDKNPNVDINFVTFKELAQKCKVLEVDIVLIEDEKLIKQGIADALNSNHINCIAPTSKWVDIISSNVNTKQLLNRYSILTPLTLTYPSTFPLLVKSDNASKIANSIDEIVKIKEKIFDISPIVANTIFLEEYLQGEVFEISWLFDGKNLLLVDDSDKTSELKNELNDYKKKLEDLLCSERIAFIGFISAKFIFSNNKLYNTGFEIFLPKPVLKIDLLYILILALYQKLNEVDITH